MLKKVLSMSSNRPLGSFWEGKTKLKYVDLFCGIGGFHSAANATGKMECVFACDIDEDCRKIYHHNYGLLPEKDICQIPPESIPDHDILCAGFPCQPFSIIGSGQGFADARGTLFFEIAKILQVKRPAAFVLENVKQLATHDKKRTLGRILKILRDLDYSVDDPQILNALHFGVPQKRERILIVGFRGDVKSFQWPKKKIPMKPLVDVLEPNPDPSTFVSERIRLARKDAHKSSVSPAIWHENKSGNISSHPYSCALRAGASYNYLLVDGERRLTPREMLRLQGFPESFKILGSDAAIRKQAGNSVPVPMVQAILEGVLNVERAEAARESRAA